jgi:hypothetical protein
MTRVPARSILASSLLLAGCTTTPSPQAAPVASAPVTRAGPTGVIGSSAAALQAQFGRPELEVREGNARKLQFVSPDCVLDAYLYPPRQGAEAVVTHVDTRLPDGRDTDRAACIASFSAR